MPETACVLIKNDAKATAEKSKSNIERRGKNKDRRVSNNNSYKGPARRMTLDRRK